MISFFLSIARTRMRTRHGACYAEPGGSKRRRTVQASLEMPPPPAAMAVAGGGFFEELPDDLVVSILADVASGADSPADLVAVMLTCKRLWKLGQYKQVFERASARCLAVRAKNWTEDAHFFLFRCANAGNLDACYLLGMIRFYCLENRGSGAALMAAAAVGGHREALYALAIIQFNGSGGSKDDRDLRSGAHLCARAASLGHNNALRELGHCLLDGYGVRRSVADGRRLLIHANARELAAALSESAMLQDGEPPRHACLLSDFGCRAEAREAHVANVFLAQWFASRPMGKAGRDGGELRLCSHTLCGRPETRLHEFRRCSVCGIVNYCSRSCQAMHWKMAHKAECAPTEWFNAANVNVHVNVNDNANAAANAGAGNAAANGNAIAGNAAAADIALS